MSKRLSDREIRLEEVRFPSIVRVHDYLRSKTGGNRYPARRDILPEEVAFALGRIIILEVRRDPLDFIYRLYGSGISRVDRDEVTNKSVQVVEPAEYRDMLLRHYTAALAAEAPVFHEIEVTAGELVASYQRGLFALSDDGHIINRLFSVSASDDALERCWEAYTAPEKVTRLRPSS